MTRDDKKLDEAPPSRPRYVSPGRVLLGVRSRLDNPNYTNVLGQDAGDTTGTRTSSPTMQHPEPFDGRSTQAPHALQTPWGGKAHGASHTPAVCILNQLNGTHTIGSRQPQQNLHSCFLIDIILNFVIIIIIVI
jgi:hypothetical protein